MANLTVANYGDLVNATKVNYGPKNKIQQVAQNYVNYVLFSLFFKKERMKTDGGQLIQRNEHLKKFPVARMKSIGQTDTVKIEDVTAQLQVPWRFADTHWAFTDQDVMLCTNEHKIFDLIDVRRNNAMIDFIEMFEAQLWTSPATTSRDILGVPHYVVTTAASTTFGINGTVPSGYSTVANISPTTFPNWKNGNVLYTAVTKADLISKLRDAFFYCNFQNLEGLKKTDYEANRDRYVCVTNRAVSSDIEDLGEAQNENLGRDVASMEVNSRVKDIYSVDGVLTIRRKPIITSQYLDGVSTNPFYGLALDYWCFYVHEIMNMKETEVLRVSDTHDSYYVAQDTWCNLVCFDRRRQFVASTS